MSQNFNELQPWFQQTTMPPRTGSVSRHKLFLWQLSFDAGACPRGPPNAADVLEICDRNFLSAEGSQTDKYPLEVLFDHAGKLPGEALGSWSVGLSIGFGTYLSCLLGLWTLFRHREWIGAVGTLSPGVPSLSAEGEPSLLTLLGAAGVTAAGLVEAWGPQLMKMLRLEVLWDPPAGHLVFDPEISGWQNCSNKPPEAHSGPYVFSPEA